MRSRRDAFQNGRDFDERVNDRRIEVRAFAGNDERDRVIV